MIAATNRELLHAVHEGHFRQDLFYLLKQTLKSLQAYPWPGNVRELQNVFERSVIVCDSDEFAMDES